MTVRTLTTTDHGPLVFEQHGRGPPLLLLHGFSHDRTLWTITGWVAALAPWFTVFTVDLRGCGQSLAPRTPTAYTLDQHIADIEALVETVGAADIQIFGWSFGGTLGLHLLRRLPAVRRAVIAGTFVGQVFTPARLTPEIAHLTELHAAQAGGDLDSRSLSPGWRAFLARTHLPTYLARLRGCLSWPALTPADLTKPVLLYTSTADTYVFPQIQAQAAAIQAMGARVHIFPGLTHRELVTARESVSPLVVSFLRETPSGQEANTVVPRHTATE
ncbi:MAG TPA: alpha/beta hydrolase [Herpetosiphonaceae bacterium]